MRSTITNPDAAPQTSSIIARRPDATRPKRARSSSPYELIGMFFSLRDGTVAWFAAAVVFFGMAFTAAFSEVGSHNAFWLFLFAFWFLAEGIRKELGKRAEREFMEREERELFDALSLRSAQIWAADQIAKEVKRRAKRLRQKERKQRRRREAEITASDSTDDIAEAA